MHRMRRLTHLSPIRYTAVNYLKGTGVYVGLHLACSPKSCLLVYSYKRTSLADGISDRVPLLLRIFSPPPNLAAFIVLKVTKQVTSAHIVQKLQSPAVRFMFRVSLPVFLHLQLLTPHYWSNSRTQ